MKEKLIEKIRKNGESLQNLKNKKLNIERQIENLEIKIRNQKFALDNLTLKEKKEVEKHFETPDDGLVESLLESM